MRMQASKVEHSFYRIDFILEVIVAQFGLEIFLPDGGDPIVFFGLVDNFVWEMLLDGLFLLALRVDVFMYQCLIYQQKPTPTNVTLENKQKIQTSKQGQKMSSSQAQKKQQKWGVKVHYSQMDRETEFQAKHVIYHSFVHRSNQQEIAEEIKKYMDKKFYGGWFAIVGRNYGLDVTHQEGTFLQASKGPLQIVIFRCSN